MTAKRWGTLAAGMMLPVIFLFVTACAVNPVSGERQLMLLSEDQEGELGRQTDLQVVQQYGLYDDAALTAAIEKRCKALGRISHRPNLDYRLKILDTPVVNAFAVPGGYIYFTRGILASLNSEAEMMGVLGHEIGHITARHSAQQYTRAQIAQIGLGLGAVLSETVGDLGGLAQIGVGMLFMKYSRDNEREADALGVEYSCKTGFDGGEMAGFFETLERMNPESDRSGLPGWFSTHPNPADRQKTVLKMAEEWKKKLGKDAWKIGKDSYLRRIDGLVYGEDPQQGYVEGDVFYHPALRFEFPVPKGWNLRNTPAVVQMVSEKEDAAILFHLSQAASVQEAARGFAAKGGVTVLRDGRTRVNGLPAHYLISRGNTQKGMIQILSHFVEKGGKVFEFHGFTAAENFRIYSDAFQRVEGGFRELTDPKRIHVQPDRIRIRETRSEATLREALTKLGVPSDELEKTALLNGTRLEERVPPRTLLKVIERRIEKH